MRGVQVTAENADRLQDASYESYVLREHTAGRKLSYASHTTCYDAQGNKTYDSWEEAAKIRAQYRREWEAEQVKADKENETDKTD
jgi:hypothetical protein